MTAEISEPPIIGFVGAGAMGTPMIAGLAAGGYVVRVFDLDWGRAARAAQEARCEAVQQASELANCGVVITMLPDSDAVEEALLGPGGIAGLLQPDTTIIDMGSSVPYRTQALAASLAKQRRGLVDAPVSGGVRRAYERKLTVMVGGTAEQFEAVKPLLGSMASQTIHVGPVGAGHAVKSLNNLLSATGLLIGIEATEGARRFGVDPTIFLDIVNQSTGRNHATETKVQQYVLSGKYDSGFAARLMVKDLRIATALLAATETPSGLSKAVLAEWEDALEGLAVGADQTEIARHIISTAD